VSSNEISDKFFLKLFDKTGDKKRIRFFDRYEIGKNFFSNNQVRPSVSLDTVFSTLVLLRHRETFEEDFLRL
jgi:hypothetical protein